MSDLPSPEALVEMMERCARATPGPWQEANLGGNGVIPAVIHEYPEERDWVPICYFSDSKGDGEAADVAENKPFIAAVRTDLPAALALIADLLDVIETMSESGDHSDNCASRRCRTIPMIDRGEWHPCDCGYDAAQKAASPYRTPAWRSVATSLRKGSA